MAGPTSAPIVREADPRKQPHASIALEVGLRIIRLGPLLVLLLIGVIFTIVTPVFANPLNLFAIIVQAAPIAILALGQLLVIVTRGIDLSVGSTIALSMIVGWFVWGLGERPAWLVILVILGVGALVGVVNGTVLVKFHIPHPFIVTLGMLSVASGLALVISNGEPKAGMPDAIIWLGSGRIDLGFIAIPIPVIIVVLAALLVSFFTRRVQWGRWIYATGGNPEGALRAGIPTGSVLISVYVLSGLAAGVAALLIAGRTASAYPTAGYQAELDAIAAVIIGGASFFGGRGTALGAVVGALIIGSIRNGLNLTQVSPSWQQVAIGVVVVAAVGLDVFRTRMERQARQSQARRQEGLDYGQ